MKKIKIIKNKGILFWITGLSGSGKTTIAHKIKSKIQKKYGPTIVVSGDDLRNIFNFKNYDSKERIILSKKFNKFAKFITNQNINLIFAVVGMIHSMRAWNKKNIKNYIEIYIKSDLKNIIKFKRKKIYFKKNNNESIVGINIKPQFPKKPHIMINNRFDKPINRLSDNIIKKIDKLIEL